MAAAHPIVFHHYDASLFSEKVRLAFGLKDLAWRSVKISPVMPRPDLMPLTGGYRRTPVMQIGADIYCDTQLILRELERRFPEPSLFPGGSSGLCHAVSMWTDRPFFQAAVGVVFARLPLAALPPGFVEDRTRLSGRKFDPAAMQAAAPAMRDHCRAYLDWIEGQLADGRSWFLGEQPSLADLSAFMNVWFLEENGAMDELAPATRPRLQAWAARVRELGHGRPTDMAARDALELARAATPETPAASDDHDPAGLRPGVRVSVTPDDYGRIPVQGELVSSSPQHVALHREDDRAGDVVVHFPRAGYVIAPL